MAIIPTVRCRRMETSIAFYTNVLDFDCVEHGGEGDPSRRPCAELLFRGGRHRCRLGRDSRRVEIKRTVGSNHVRRTGSVTTNEFWSIIEASLTSWDPDLVNENQESTHFADRVLW